MASSGGHWGKSGFVPAGGTATANEAPSAAAGLADQSLSEFANSVQKAADAVTGEGHFGDRAFISSVYDQLTKSGDKMSLNQFKERLLEANQKGLIYLRRLDIWGHFSDATAAERAKADSNMRQGRRSETRHPFGAEFHLIERNVGSRPGR